MNQEFYKNIKLDANTIIFAFRNAFPIRKHDFSVAFLNCRDLNGRKHDATAKKPHAIACFCKKRIPFCSSFSPENSNANDYLSKQLKTRVFLLKFECK
jgi:hypothetical protein